MLKKIGKLYQSAGIALTLFWFFIAFASPKKEDVGQGLMFGDMTQGGINKTSYAFIIEGNNHFNQKKSIWGIRQYGYAQSRLELGSPFGLTMDSVSGIILYGLNENMEGLWPFLGIEPFSGHITWNSDSLNHHFYEWMPMMSAGFQFSLGSCFILTIAKGGIGVGNLNQPNLFPQSHLGYGMGNHFNCENFNFGFTLNRMKFPGSLDYLFSTIDLAIDDSKLPYYFGIRGEFLGAIDPPRLMSVSLEKRIMLIIRSSIN